MYRILDTQTKTLLKPVYKTIHSAKNAENRLDNQYGAVRYIKVSVDSVTEYVERGLILTVL